MSNKNIPEYLISTYTLLEKAFTGQLDDDQYFIVLYYLYDYIADDHLAKVMADITKRNYWVIMNDLLFIGSINDITDLKIPVEVIKNIKYALDKAGYKKWTEEE